MGIGSSHQTKIEREFGGIGEGDDEERFFGLENFGNTCYCNSVLQALYFCEPLRHHLAELRQEEALGSSIGGAGVTIGGGSSTGGGIGVSGARADDNSVLSQLAELFAMISTQKRRSGSLAPTSFLRTLRERNELFRGNMQQDAHEFFNFILNEMADSLIARKKRMMQAAAAKQQSERREAQASHDHQDRHQHHQLQSQTLRREEPHQHRAQNQRHHEDDRNHHHSQESTQHEQPSHQPDTRRSAWPKMGLKTGFGNGGSKNSSVAGAELPPVAGTDLPSLTKTSAVPGVAKDRDTEDRSSGVGSGGGRSSGGAGGNVSSPPRSSGAPASKQQPQGGTPSGGIGADPNGEESTETWVHRIFQGVLTNQTKCLCCETVSNRDEPFMDLSLDVEQNSSVSACLRSFSSTETLTKKNKFFCENCNALQEAEKKIELKRLPRVLTLHLKRFKYVESLDSFSKLSHRVVFPLELRAPNMMEGPGEADADARLYRLFAVVVHIGRGPNHGHYVAIVKSGGHWILFDDDVVDHVPEEVLKQCFGLSRPAVGATNTGYLLFYDCGEDGGERVAPG